MAEALWGEHPIGMRRFNALLGGLPPDSALVRSYDPERLGVGWGTTQELLAALAELVDGTNRLIFMQNAKKGTRVPSPIFIPRPGTRRTTRNATPEELAVLFGDTGIMIRGEKLTEENGD